MAVEDVQHQICRSGLCCTQLHIQRVIAGSTIGSDTSAPHVESVPLFSHITPLPVTPALTPEGLCPSTLKSETAGKPPTG
jgi:hypothetical protein